MSKLALGPNQLPNGYCGISPGAKWPGNEAAHSPPSSIEVKSVYVCGAIPQLPNTYSWHGA